MSKSGLYAHFKSKEELELATIETAAEIFERDVLGPARESPGGLGRVWRSARRSSGTWNGGCSRAVLLRDRLGPARVAPGRPRDRVMELQGDGSGSSPRRWAKPSTWASCRGIPTSAIGLRGHCDDGPGEFRLDRDRDPQVLVGPGSASAT